MKNREPSKYLNKLETLNRRLILNHPNRSWVEEEYKRQKAGFKGEQELDYYLSFLPKKDSITLPNIRLQQKDSDYFFQLDSVALTTKCILTFDSKHLSGEITFNAATKQLSRINVDGLTEIFKNPIEQAYQHRFQLNKHFDKDYPDIPIFSFAIFTHPKSVLKTASQNEKLPNNMMRADCLPKILIELMNSNKKNIMDKKTLNQIAKYLVENDVPYNPDVLEKFNICKEHIIKGVHCPVCFHISMARKNSGRWFCPQCKYENVNAHIYTINDFIYLFGEYATNKQLREFLCLPSRIASYRSIKRANVKQYGTKKGTYYHLTLQHPNPTQTQH